MTLYLTTGTPDIALVTLFTAGLYMYRDIGMTQFIPYILFQVVAQPVSVFQTDFLGHYHM
tara:strand:+ start:349 stop:528 length:180 start_codon:yes stop_codon:yes gene_type:complete